MSSRERVEITRRALAIGLGVRALAVAVAVWLVVDLAAGLLSATGAATIEAPIARLVAAMLSLGAGVLIVTRGARLSRARVALWIEERTPDLRYALVTALDPAYEGSSAAARLERDVARVSWTAAVRRALGRSLIIPLTAVAIAAALWLLLPRTVGGDAVAAARAQSGAAGHGASVDPLARIVATVRPPSYAGRRASTIEDPSSIGGLAGSEIVIEGRGAPSLVSAEVAGRLVEPQRGEEGWRVAWRLDVRPAVVRLRAGTRERLIALEPRVDSVPTVVLSAPPRDSVLRAAEGSVPLAAVATDDIGLVGAHFEYIVSSGQGESFDFRSGTIGRATFRGATRGTLSGTLGFAALSLVPGDVVHVRAVARDANDVTGPGIGSSETRVFRIARAGEYDTVAVEGAPPPEADKSLISQRMLIQLTEALERRRPRIPRATLLAESRRIGRDQTRLRKQVGDIIFARLGDDPTGEHAHDEDDDAADTLGARTPEDVLRAADEATGVRGEEVLDFEGDETPVVAINRPLLEAYNAMWEASRFLDQGETNRALPPMRVALAAIQRARQAERLYLRGRPPAVVVDLARARLQGKDTGVGSTRRPRTPLDEGARRAERFLAAVRLIEQAPSAAADSLLLLRVDALGDAPEAAAALGDLVTALRSGGDATEALIRARRALDAGARVPRALSGWRGAW